MQYLLRSSSKTWVKQSQVMSGARKNVWFDWRSYVDNGYHVTIGLMFYRYIHKPSQTVCIYIYMYNIYITLWCFFTVHVYHVYLFRIVSNNIYIYIYIYIQTHSPNQKCRYRTIRISRWRYVRCPSLGASEPNIHGGWSSHGFTAKKWINNDKLI